MRTPALLMRLSLFVCLVGATTVAVAATGQQLYASCAACHGTRGEGNAALGAPAIASVSLGETRTFKLRHRRRQGVTAIDLPHGSLLLMAGATQHHYVHAVPKTSRALRERINLTFRLVSIYLTPLARPPSTG